MSGDLTADSSFAVHVKKPAISLESLLKVMDDASKADSDTKPVILDRSTVEQMLKHLQMARATAGHCDWPSIADATSGGSDVDSDNVNLPSVSVDKDFVDVMSDNIAAVTLTVAANSDNFSNDDKAAKNDGAGDATTTWVATASTVASYSAAATITTTTGGRDAMLSVADSGNCSNCDKEMKTDVSSDGDRDHVLHGHYGTANALVLDHSRYGMCASNADDDVESEPRDSDEDPDEDDSEDVALHPSNQLCQRLQEAGARQPKLVRALVIGISKYVNLSQLNNAVNDARAIKKALEKQGVQVFYAENCTITDLEAIKNKYLNSLQEGEVTFVFFAGHGVKFANTNRLLAISAPSATHCNYANESLDLSALLNGIKAKGVRTSVVMLDCCRESVCPKTGGATGPGALDAKRVKGPSGTCVLFACSANSKAPDAGGDGHGLFTKHVLRNLTLPNLEIHTMFRRVCKAVAEESDGMQEPCFDSSIYDDKVCLFKKR